MTYDEIKKNKEICECLRKGDENLGVLGYTDHSAAHCTMVAKRAAYILKKFGYSEEDIELVKIAGFMHDIGNVVNRKHHAEYGAILANEILKVQVVVAQLQVFGTAESDGIAVQVKQIH